MYTDVYLSAHHVYALWQADNELWLANRNLYVERILNQFSSVLFGVRPYLSFVICFLIY